MSWETGTTHSDNACFFYFVNDFFLGKSCHILTWSELSFLILSIILNDNGIHHISNRYTAWFNGFYGTGYRCVDWRRNKTSCFCNLLTS